MIFLAQVPEHIRKIHAAVNELITQPGFENHTLDKSGAPVRSATLCDLKLAKTIDTVRIYRTHGDGRKRPVLNVSLDKTGENKFPTDLRVLGGTIDRKFAESLAEKLGHQKFRIIGDGQE